MCNTVRLNPPLDGIIVLQVFCAGNDDRVCGRPCAKVCRRACARACARACTSTISNTNNEQICTNDIPIYSIETERLSIEKCYV